MRTTLLCDLDDTLYPPTAPVRQAVRNAMTRFIVEHLGMTVAEAHALRQSFRGHYPMTLHGLMDRYGIDPQVYLDTVHDLDITAILAPDPALNDLLTDLPCQRVIFTNAPQAHAERVLEALAIAHHFSGIYDLHWLRYQPKPDPAGYHRLLDQLGISGQQAVMIDDRADNLLPAHELGIATILVGSSQYAFGVDNVAADISAALRIVRNLLAAPDTRTRR
jgi:putative hydrolase of the HAD superfamily